MALTDRIKNAWKAFSGNGPDAIRTGLGPGTFGSGRPDRPPRTTRADRSIISAIYNRLAVDVANVPIKHVRLDALGRYQEEIKSGLNRCLNFKANIDQAATHFRQDIAWRVLNDGVAAIVPVDWVEPLGKPGKIIIRTARVGSIVEWYPNAVKVKLYNEKTAQHDEIILPKKRVAIIENPFYNVMNAPNSTLQRLSRKLALLDSVDEQASSGKLDLIIQLPYNTRHDNRKAHAAERRKEIEMQLTGSKYGIAYAEVDERITQLNRPIENNLLTQVEYLTRQLYNQLGVSEEVFKGTATELIMTDYYNRTIEPILTAIAEGLKQAFLTIADVEAGESIEFYRDPFKIVSIASVADLADKFTRNEILSPNEVRGIVGFAPDPNDKSNELRNRNMPEPEGNSQNDTGP